MLYVIKKLLAVALVFITAFSLTACGGGISGKELQKLIEKAELCPNADISTVKVLSEAEVEGGARSVLFSAKLSNTDETCFYVAIVSAKGDDIKNLTYAYAPMDYLHEEITENRNEALNVTYFKKIAEKLGEDADYFSSEDNSIEFLRSLTGNGGITSAVTAQDAIAEIAKFRLGLDETEDFCGIFEEDNANPICYAAAVTKSVYVWDWLPEEKYLSYVSSNTKEDLENAEKEYGAPYRDETVWVTFDLSGAETGTYVTKAQLYKTVTGKDKDFGEVENETDGVLKLVAVTNKSPYVYEQNGEILGIDIEIAASIADALNMELEISAVTSADGAVNATADGSFHMAMGALTADSSKDGITFTDSYYKDCVIVLCPKNSRLNNKICSALSQMKSKGEIDKITGNAEDKAEREEEKEESNAEKNAEVTAPAAETPAGDSSKIAYRVRKDGSDPSTQLSAFAGLENAVKEVNDHPGEGYKVYDMSGNLVYEP